MADVALTLFERQVKQALKLYAHPERLGQQSPLASAYFLGRALRDVPRPMTARVRGDVLRTAMRMAAGRLWHGPLPQTRDEMLDAIATIRRNPDDSRYAYVVIELRCFHDYINPNRTSDIWEQPHLLPGSKSQHYRDFDEAVKQLAAMLLDDLQPTLRPERPQPPEALYGYDRQLMLLTEALARGRSIALNGPGGIGKTSIGATAVERLSNHPAFWFTLRPGFNDGANSLFFALGSFLHEQGASNLWQFLVTANGNIQDLNLAAGLLRQDLTLLAEHSPILCFDDLEHLFTGNLGLVTSAHAQLLELIEGLRGTTPILLISQRTLPVSDLHLELTGLSVADVMRLWRAAGRDLSSAEAERLHAYTGGNPRLLTLMLMFQSEAETDLDIPNGQTVAPSLLPAFQRLWRRLRPEERRTLQQLSVYQSYAPEDVVQPAILDTLMRLRLIERDGQGGVILLPALAPIVQGDLSPELGETLHHEAAIVHLERGAYTAAAYHFVKSNQANRAVQVWFPQRQHAIARGEADAACQIFSLISRQQLDKSERKALDIIRAELRQLAGQYEEGLHELEQIDWADKSESSTRLWMLRGELQDALGYPDHALTSYEEGARVTARLLGRLASLHQRRGMLFQRSRDLKASWQEVHRAEFDLEVLRGVLLEEEGSYHMALEAYRRARSLAEQIEDDTLRAQAERWLAAVYGRRQQLEEAVTHATQSIAIYERLGDRVNLEKMRSNMAFIYVQTRQFQAAIDVGVPAYTFFVAMRDPYFAAVTAANLAEASYELGDLDNAVRYANEVLELGNRFAAPYARFTLGQIDLARHNPAGAMAHFSEAIQIAGQNDDPYMVAYARRALGQAYLATADVGAARQQFRSALELFRQFDMLVEVEATEQLLK